MIQNYRQIKVINGIGLAADRPDANDVLEGSLYFSTDSMVLERSDGSAWEAYSGGASPSAPPSGMWAYSFNNSPTKTVPGPGEITFNAPYPYSNVTSIQIHRISRTTVDLQVALLNKPVGSEIYVQVIEDADFWVRFNTTGMGVEQGNVVQFPVTWVSDSGSTFPAGRTSSYPEVQVVFVGAAEGAHHLTHETGGTDPITRLDAGVIVSGIVGSARLPANIAYTDKPNIFTDNQTIGTPTTPGHLTLHGNLQIDKTVFGMENIYAAGNLYEANRATPIGWAIAHNLVPMAPTAISVQNSCCYSRVGNLLTLQAYLSDTFTGAAGDYALRYYLPDYISAGYSSIGPAMLFSSAFGGWEVGACIIDAGWNYVEVYRAGVQAIPQSTTMQARFSISVHVQ